VALNYLDILAKHFPKVSSLPATDTGAAAAAPVSHFTPVGHKPVGLERFRSMAGAMQTVANASISQEIERITSMPVSPDPTEEEIDLISLWYFPDGGIRLFPEQAKAMMEFFLYGSIFAPIAVGRGKSLVSVLTANDAYVNFGKKKILLLNPSHLVGQLRSTELPKYRKHGSINVPFFWLAQLNAVKRMQEAQSGKTGCYVLSYNNTSGKEGAEILHAIQPDMIICDEIHRVLSQVSARGRRFRETVKIYSPSLVCLSGTMTQKSPKDYHFAAVHSLQERCFLPRPAMLSEEWAKIIDSNAATLDQFEPGQAPQAGDINKLVSWNNKHFSKERVTKDLVGVREAFKRRMHTTPGVIASKGDLLGTSLRVSNLVISDDEKTSRPGWDRLKELVDNLVNLWVAPNGDELEHAMHIWRYRYELEGIGGYNDLSWPSIDRISKRRGISTTEAEDLFSRSLFHHKQHQEYSRQLRKWITSRAKTGLDTPMLIGNDMYRNGAKNVGGTLYQAWTAVRDADFEGRVERVGTFVRVCDFRIKKIVEWAKHLHKEDPTRGALLWYDNQGVGIWLAEAFKEAGLPYLHCPAGSEGLARLTDETKKDHFALATYNAFNEGLNIQKIHSRMFYCQWERQAKLMEQSVGRLHRPGQPDDEVRVWGSFCSEFDWVLLAACLNDAAYVHQTTGTQKLMIADWDFRPKIIPYAVLKQWGADPTESTVASVKLLEDKFKEQEG
jgi:hypothetical protein